MNKKPVIWAIVLLLVVFIVLIISTLFGGKTDEEKKDATIVKSYSDFFTVNSCLYRVITYLQVKDSDTMLLLLPEKYKKENSVTKSNVLDFFEDVNENSTYVSKKMYYKKVNDNLTKYYVFGTIDTFDSTSNDVTILLESKETYFIVYLDSKNNTFMIEPYSGEIFKGEKNE